MGPYRTSATIEEVYEPEMTERERWYQESLWEKQEMARRAKERERATNRSNMGCGLVFVVVFFVFPIASCLRDILR